MLLKRLRQRVSLAILVQMDPNSLQEGCYAADAADTAV
jgi:hypothetical protein